MQLAQTMTQNILNPFVHSTLRLLALTPPVLRSNFLTRVCGRLVSFSGMKGKITTNLGLKNDFRIDYPDARHPQLIFGRPIDYLGERGALLLTQSLVGRAGAFLDIGSHYGYFTYVAANATRQTPIYYFEPNPELFSLIASTVTKNGLNHVTGVQKAVGKENTRTQFYINLCDPALSSLHSEVYELTENKKIDVDVITLQSFLSENPELNHILVKVDVENAEFDFVEGAKNVFNRIDFLILEILADAVKKDLIGKLIHDGKYQAYYINDFKITSAPEGRFTFSPGQVNWLFCRKSPDELKEVLRGTAFQVL